MQDMTEYTFDSLLHDMQLYGCEYQVKTVDYYGFDGISSIQDLSRIGYNEESEIKTSKKVKNSHIGIVIHKLDEARYEIVCTYKAFASKRSGVLKYDDVLAASNIENTLKDIGCDDGVRIFMKYHGTYWIEVSKKYFNYIPSIVKSLYVNVFQKPVKEVYDRFGANISETDVNSYDELKFSALDNI